ncbi:MAG: helix-turn-helix domain-containing protein [Clostridia bacterium]|nr:helix-turn-helix domain-containing protein [Clostridia bacterium]
MDFTNTFDNYDFIKLGKLNLSSDTKIVILYARFMHNSGAVWTLDKHTHSFYELHFPLIGNCELALQDDSTVSLGVNDYILIHPNTEHRFAKFSDDFLRLSIAFDIQHNDKLLAEYDKYVLNQSTDQIRHHLDKMLSEYQTQNLGYQNVVDLHIQSVLIEVLRIYSSLLEIREGKDNISQQIFNRALEFIRNNISMNITTEDVAKNVNLSSRQLNRIFHTNLSMTISAFIKNERILRVRDHLKKTSLSLKEIAVLTGFNDEYILCKTFKKATGTSPGKYRANYKRKH